MQDTWGVPRPQLWVNRGQGVGLPFKTMEKAGKNVCRSHPRPDPAHLYNEQWKQGRSSPRAVQGFAPEPWKSLYDKWPPSGGLRSFRCPCLAEGGNCHIPESKDTDHMFNQPHSAPGRTGARQ